MSRTTPSATIHALIAAPAHKEKPMPPSPATKSNGITGCTADVMRKQHDSTWLLSIDNDWGIAIVADGVAS